MVGVIQSITRDDLGEWKTQFLAFIVRARRFMRIGLSPLEKLIDSLLGVVLVDWNFWILHGGGNSDRAT